MTGIPRCRSSSAGARRPVPDLRAEASFTSHRRKRTSTDHRRLSGGGLIPLCPSPASTKPQDMNGLRFLLQKELRNSDVGSLGRVVLPKKEAETHLPFLTAREGISLAMHDMETSQIWYFRFRFWPNNKSRMYILENTGEFVRSYGLQLGDFMMLFKDDEKDRYFIQARKVVCQDRPTFAAIPPAEDGIFDAIVTDIVVARARYSDLYLPLAEGMNMAFGLNCAFSADLCEFP